MKKPLLLLVDDDRAVLEALEAELAPAFREICRIEAFDDPREVLGSLPGWARERRAIAVAIVDQKMPHLTGVELLGALNRAAGAAASSATGGRPASHPAAHLHAILLTGYSELALAIAAKNEAGADRYMEKPWTSEDLRRSVRHSLRAHLSQSGHDRHLVYRELTGANELRTYLRLRFENYSHTSDLAHRLPATKKRLDVDEYDIESRSYGLFECALAHQEQVGGLRVIGEPSEVGGRALIQIVSEDLDLHHRATAPRTQPLEFLKEWPEPAPVLKALERCREHGEQVREVGRLVLKPSSRAVGLPPGAEVLLLLEGTAAEVGFARGVENTFVHAVATHRAAYARVGFALVEGTRPTYEEAYSRTNVCLHGRPDRIKPPVRERILSSAGRLRARGTACRCATYPQCLAGPYADGVLSGTDLFCPARAVEIVAAPAPVPGREPSGAEFDDVP